jgi:hypothetical protein
MIHDEFATSLGAHTATQYVTQFASGCDAPGGHGASFTVVVKVMFVAVFQHAAEAGGRIVCHGNHNTLRYELDGMVWCGVVLDVLTMEYGCGALVIGGETKTTESESSSSNTINTMILFLDLDI